MKLISVPKAAIEKGVHRNAIYFQINKGTFKLAEGEKPLRIIVNKAYLDWQADETKKGAIKNNSASTK